MLGMPAETAYDLRFRLLGIPVRVHPLFWLFMWLLSGTGQDLRAALPFIACAFVSILVHEFGHGLSSRFFGQEPRSIALYAMGGLCETQSDRLAPGQRAAVLLAGPGAGFLLLGLALLGGYAAWGLSPQGSLAFIDVGKLNQADFERAFNLRLNHPTVFDAYHDLLWINFWWGVFNLFPIWPLDGGQLAQVILTSVNRRNGRRWGHVVSMLTSGGLALWELRRGNHYMAFFMAYFAFMNFQILQTIHETARYNVYDEDSWRR